MFDIGFWEMVLVAVVALVVIGPERLPKAARMAGLWVGRARRTLTAMKAEIDQEFRAQELQEIMKKQALSNPLETILEDTGEGTREAPRPIATATPAGDPAPAPQSTATVRGSGDQPAA